MKTTVSNILSKTIGGRVGNNIIDVIRMSDSPTEGDQLGQFVNRNRSLIKEFVLVICGFLIFIMIVLFFMLLIVIMLNQETITLQQQQYTTTLLENYDIRNRNKL